MDAEEGGEGAGRLVGAARNPARTGKRTARSWIVMRPLKTPLAPDRLMEILESEKTLVAGRRLAQSGKLPGKRKEKMSAPVRKKRRAGMASMV